MDEQLLVVGGTWAVIANCWRPEDGRPLDAATAGYAKTVLSQLH